MENNKKQRKNEIVDENQNVTAGKIETEDIGGTSRNAAKTQEKRNE